MPKVTNERMKRIHPNSRRASHISKVNVKVAKKVARIKERAAKIDSTVTKYLWFREHLDRDAGCYDNEMLGRLVERYLSRFDEEIEQIDIINKVGKRTTTQHDARKRSITVANEHERMLFLSSGVQIPDLTTKKLFREFKEWDGNPKSLPKLKVIDFSKPKTLNKEKTK